MSLRANVGNEFLRYSYRVRATSRSRYLPEDDNEKVRQRTFLRVPLTGASTPGPGGSATVWLVQVIHIKVSGKDGPSYLGSNPFNKKIRLCAAAQNLGQQAAANAASTRGDWRVVAVSLGDFNVAQAEVLNTPSASPWPSTPSTWSRTRASWTRWAGFTRTSCWWTPSRASC